MADDKKQKTEYECPKCHSKDCFFNVDICVKAPMKYFHALSKSAIRDKDVELLFAKWTSIDIVCPNCGVVYLSKHPMA